MTNPPPGPDTGPPPPPTWTAPGTPSVVPPEPVRSRRAGTGLLVTVVALLLVAAGLVTGSLLLPPDPASGRLAAGIAPSNDATVSVALPAPTPGNPVLPGNAPTGPAAALYDALFAGLTDVDPTTGAVEPRLADSWESTDALTWTFHLKEGLVFHDGQPVNAQSFVDTWNFTGDARNAMLDSDLFADVEGYFVNGTDTLSGLTAVDDHTLTVELSRPRSDLPRLVAQPGFAPLPPQCLTSLDACADTPIGTGPFYAPDGWSDRAGDTVTLRRFDGYPGNPPQYGGLTVVFYQEADAGLNRFESGAIDLAQFTQDDPPADTADLDPRVGSETFYLNFPDTKKYRDPRFRRAISLALDREAAFGTLTGNADAAATAFTSPVLADTVADGCSSCRHDPAEAATVWKDLDWSGDSLDILALQGTFDQALAETVCQQIQEALDLECQVEVLAPPDYYERLLYPDHLPVSLLGWMPNGGSAASVFRDYFPGLVGYDDEDFAAAVRDWTSAVDEGTATAAATTATGLLDEDLPAVPLGYGVNRLGVTGAVDPASVLIDPATGAIALELVTTTA